MLVSHTNKRLSQEEYLSIIIGVQTVLIKQHFFQSSVYKTAQLPLELKSLASTISVLVAKENLTAPRRGPSSSVIPKEKVYCCIAAMNMLCSHPEAYQFCWPGQGVTWLSFFLLLLVLSGLWSLLIKGDTISQLSQET